MGEVQIEILKSLIQERFGVNVTFDAGRVVYKETIQNTVEGVGHFEPLRHYAEVHLLMEPGERGSGLVFESACSEDELNLNWQRLILTHLGEKVHRGCTDRIRGYRHEDHADVRQGPPEAYGRRGLQTGDLPGSPAGTDAGGEYPAGALL